MLAILILLLRYFLMIILFVFLGWIIYTLWRDLRVQSQIVTTQKIPQITLSLESDPDATKKIFSQPELIIGREPDCDFQIPEESVSSQHARLSYRYLQWWVEDLQSTNGTFLNEQRVETATVVIKGDELQIGRQVTLINIETND